MSISCQTSPPHSEPAIPRSLNPIFLYISTLESRHVSTILLRPRARSRLQYASTILVASPCLRYSGSTLRPRIILFFPLRLLSPVSRKKSSLSTSSSVASPLMKPAIRPVSLSTATRNSSGTCMTRSFIRSLEHASFGGKQVSSISAASSHSSGRMLLNSYSFIDISSQPCGAPIQLSFSSYSALIKLLFSSYSTLKQFSIIAQSSLNHRSIIAQSSLNQRYHIIDRNTLLCSYCSKVFILIFFTHNAVTF